MKNLTYLLTLVVLFSLPFTSDAKRKPDWVKQRPNDPTYFIGIGMTAKEGSEVEYRRNARNVALKQMSSEIKVTISSNSVLRKIETDNDFKEAYESKVETSVLETLEGYEVITWEDRKEYWVMARLSKERYARMKEMKLDKAKMMAGSFIMDAKKAIAVNDAFSALNYLSKAAGSLRDHLEDDLTYKTVDGTYNVGTEVFSTIQDVFRRTELLPVQPGYQIQFSKQLQVPIGVNALFVSNNGEKVALTGFPLAFHFSKGEGLLSSQAKTNLDGYAGVSITRLISKRKVQEITATFDFSHAIDNETDEELKKLLQVFFPAKQMPTTAIKLEVQKSKAYLITEEKVFGEENDKGAFSSMIKTELNNNFFTFTQNKEDSDFIVKISSNFVSGDKRKGQGYEVYLVFADFSITITDTKSQTEIFADELSGIRGMRPGNHEYALKDSRTKLIEQFKKEIEPRLEQVDM
ncbi:LPP20 family lipoprotein [Carboxylicivirga sp. N1Y90]|uniref:LPP20 family lipoprotein n=1 Tax=Carboxylicivirga fragile TaxID=3417571 RepID=UPI003D33A6DB|nr:LPP20 family lipoprotein [Marinilabiliaceae bacterium N1Y90]